MPQHDYEDANSGTPAARTAPSYELLQHPSRHLVPANLGRSPRNPSAVGMIFLSRGLVETSIFGVKHLQKPALRGSVARISGQRH
jgi:hypothetical protein